MELGIGDDRLSCDFIERDVLCRQSRCRSDQHRVRDAIRKVDRPLHCLHSAEAAADDRSPANDAERVRQKGLRGDPVPHRHHREVRSVNSARFRIDRTWSGAAVAATEVVEAHHVEVIRVDRLAGTDAVVPPAGPLVFGAVIAGGMVMSRQRVTDEHRVRTRGIQLAVRFVDEIYARQDAPAQQRNRLVESQVLRRNEPNGIGRDAVLHRTAESKVNGVETPATDCRWRAAARLRQQAGEDRRQQIVAD